MFATAISSSTAQPTLPIYPVPPAPSEPLLETSPGFHLEAASLQPRLHHHSWISRARLSDDGFCDSTAHINLSHHLTMGLEATGKTLSYRALAELGLGTRQAWDLAADNMVLAARSPQGTRFYIRNATHTTDIRSSENSAVQVKTPGAPITAWLAHPRTFTILNNHLEDLLGPDLTYLTPLQDLLIAVPSGNKTRKHLEKWASRIHTEPQHPGVEKITPTPLRYRLGFPAIAQSPAQTVSQQAA